MAKQRRKPTTQEVFARVFDLTQRDHLSDFDVANIARKLTELPHRERVAKRSLKELVSHEKPSRRRVGITACRVIGRFGVPGLREALLQRLADTDRWVRHDAVLAVGAAGYDGSEVRELLENLVGDRDALKIAERGLWIWQPNGGVSSVNCDESNVDVWTRVQARCALDSLLEKQADLIAAPDPAWLTSDVLGLAWTIRETDAADLLPILADALEEAGCAKAELLRQCRAREGCVWILEWLIGPS